MTRTLSNQIQRRKIDHDEYMNIHYLFRSIHFAVFAVVVVMVKIIVIVSVIILEVMMVVFQIEVVTLDWRRQNFKLQILLSFLIGAK